METVNFVLSGLGGQGILFMTRVVAQAALERGFEVTVAETHGMAQRGGSVLSHIRLGPVRSSLVRAGTARFLMALEENEAYRNLPFLARGGSLYANAPKADFPRKEVKGYIARMGMRSRAFQAGGLALGLGAPMAANLSLLGFFAAFAEGPLTPGDLRRTIDRISPARFREMNLRVFEAGFAQGLPSPHPGSSR